jgi:hypothetical protein
MTDIQHSIKLFGIVLIAGGPVKCSLQCLRRDLRNKITRVAESLAHAGLAIHNLPP